MNKSQLEYYMEYLPYNFDISVIGSVCLGHRGGLPYVTEEGKLPNPRLLSDF